MLQLKCYRSLSSDSIIPKGVFMQIKKDHIKQDLLEAGLNEFLIFGYEKASLRRIVKNANTTTGNFYNYFENKESLFDALISPSFLVFKWIFDHHEVFDAHRDLWEIYDIPKLRSRLIVVMDKWVPELDSGFILLFKKSEGTRYAFFKEAFIDYLSDYLYDQMHRLQLNYLYKEFSKVLSKQVIDGFISILEMPIASDLKHKLMVEHLIHTMVGLIKMAH